MKIFMYGHNGSDNHGCEAIVRSAYKILNQLGELVLVSNGKEMDEKYNLDEIVTLYNEQIELPKFNIKNIYSWVLLKLFKNREPAERSLYYTTMKKMKKDDIYLAIGGDNYCCGNRHRYTRMHMLAKKRTKKTVLFGCSVEDVNDEKIRKDLASYSLIIARETLSYEILKKVNKNTVLLPDPAFQLPIEEGILPDGLSKDMLKNTVGINVSPLIMRYENKEGITYANYEELIKYILENTSDNIALLPHVVIPNGSDEIVLDKLYEAFKYTKRVYKIADQNACQLKGVISNLKSLVCARTHASIAAYSTCVPVLVVGYSIKAKGIANDIFGSYEDYVLPTQELETKDGLKNAYVKFMDNYDNIKNRLEEFIPEYRENALLIKDEIEKIL